MPDLSDLFDSFHSRAVRLECLPVYSVPEEHEAFLAFMAGKHPSPQWISEWCDFVTTTTESGRVIERIRIVPEPPTDYYSFESTMGYPLTSAAGEIVSLVAQSSVPSGVHLFDFWLFDDSTAGILHYDNQGAFLEATVESGASDVLEMRAVLDALRPHCIPYSDPS